MADTKCAVVGCASEGVAGRCFGDGSSHHHGRIHYDCDRVAKSEHGLVFREKPNEWFLMCRPHQVFLVEKMREKGMLPEGW